MYRILLDVNGWQNLYDFKSGEEVIMPDKECYKVACDLAKKHPYPGDTNIKALSWISDTALAAVEKYDADFVFLSYANSAFMQVNNDLSEKEIKEICECTMSEALRFVEKTDYKPIIVSNASLKKFDKVVDTNDIEGYLTISTLDPYMAGIYLSEESDLIWAKETEGISYETKEEFVRRYPNIDDNLLNTLPDIFLYSDDNRAFTRIENRGMMMYALPKKEDYSYVYSTFSDLPDSIFDIRDYISKKLDDGEKIALIVTEAIDELFLPKGTKRLSRVKNGMRYSEGIGFYYALCQSNEFFEGGMPRLFHSSSLIKRKERVYPFSFVRNENFDKALGIKKNIKSIAVGSRSGLTHSATMCDYSIECYSRGLAESGILVFVNEDKFE